MKKIIKNFSILAVAVAVMAACGESERLIFDEPASIYFYSSQWGGDMPNTLGDSVQWSFFGKTDDFTAASAELRLMATGYKVDRDREVRLVINPESTLPAEDIIIAERIVLPANTLELVVPVGIKRTDKLRSGIYWVEFMVEDSEDLKKGYYNQLSFRFFMTDTAIRPSGWVQAAYGDYSIVKHRFILSVMPDINWSSLPGVYIANNAKLRQAIMEYEKENGPLYGLAEDGEESIRVTFPS